jgi:hypothetical protein
MEAKVLYNDWRYLYNHCRPHRRAWLPTTAVFPAAFNKRGPVSAFLDSQSLAAGFDTRRHGLQ